MVSVRAWSADTDLRTVAGHRVAYKQRTCAPHICSTAVRRERVFCCDGDVWLVTRKALLRILMDIAEYEMERPNSSLYSSVFVR